MWLPNDELPKSASNGFFYCVSKKYGSWIAVAPVKETAKTLYCCKVLAKKVKEEWNGDVCTYIEEPDNVFCKGVQGRAYVYRIPKKDYPREHIHSVDFSN